MSMNGVPFIEELVYDPSAGPLRYLWLAYIDSVDLTQHCKKAFVGETSQRVATRLIQDAAAPVIFRDVTLDEAPARAFYLCGVSTPYVWAKNVHLAFVYDSNAAIDFEAGAVRARLHNARQLSIVAQDIDPSHPKATDTHYATCRNWQFAWTFEKMRRHGELNKRPRVF
jgi:hypothetical protein